MAISHAFSNTVADGTNTGIVRPVDWNSAHNQFLTVTGNTVGQSTFSGSNIVFGAGANITLTATTGATSLAATRTITFRGQVYIP